MIKYIFITVTFLLMAGKSSFPSDYRDRAIFFIDDSPASLGRGGTGLSSPGIDSFSKNPASLWGVRDSAFGLQYGTVPGNREFYNPSLSIGMATSYGIFGASLKTIIFPGDPGPGHMTGINMGWGRDFTESLKLGFSIKSYYSDSDNINYYAGAALGGIYRFMYSSRGDGFGLFSPAIGLLINLGIPAGKERDDINFNGAGLGYNFHFYKREGFSAAFYNDYSFAARYRVFPAKAGIEFDIMNTLLMRMGAMGGTTNEHRGLTFGLGLKYSNDTFWGSADYSIMLFKNKNYLHYAGLTGLFSGTGRTIPSAAVSPDRMYISPNDDGIDDFVRIRLDARDRSEIKGWRLTITDSAGKVVRVFIRLAPDNKKPDLAVLVNRFLSKSESMYIPDYIIWDGRDDKGRIVPDGHYYYSFHIWNEWNNISVQKKGELIVDNDPPKVMLKKVPSAGTGDKDSLMVESIEQAVKTAAGDTCSGSFHDNRGREVKKYHWAGKDVPAMVQWDGRDMDGKELPLGRYRYTAECSDRSGNSSSDSIYDVTMSGTVNYADIKFESPFHSCLAGKKLKLFPVLNRLNGLKSWNITMAYKNSITGIFKGSESIPKEIAWECRGPSGSMPADGMYNFRLQAEYENGITITGMESPVIFDSTPPVLNITPLPLVFSPGSGNNENLLVIKTLCSKKTGIKNWLLAVFTHSGRLFKTFSGKGAIPGEIIWNGLGSGSEEPESAIDYSIRIEAEDNAGNSGISDSASIMTGLLLAPVYKGYKITLSTLHFEFRDSSIQKRSQALMNRLHEILKKYDDYDIIVKSHTWEMENEEKNLELSERRAEAVVSFLTSRGIERSRITYSGMGSTSPLFQQPGEDNRRRNERIEIFIQQKEY